MTSVLIVDDEPVVLRSTARIIGQLRAAWRVVGATAAEPALEALENGSYDVIVSDMRMPVVDGAEFLARVQALRPDTVRIILTGNAEPAVMTRALRIAHEVLAKPCRPDHLVDRIERALALRSALNAGSSSNR